jgi:hypothetical protein
LTHAGDATPVETPTEERIGVIQGAGRPSGRERLTDEPRGQASAALAAFVSSTRDAHRACGTARQLLVAGTTGAVVTAAAATTISALGSPGDPAQLPFFRRRAQRIPVEVGDAGRTGRGEHSAERGAEDHWRA